MTSLTVAICTWNRSALLRKTLEALRHVDVPGDASLEIIVVNNNCTDDTSAVIRAFSGTLPVREAFEPEPGLSNARNRAVDSARGDYILFIDDDILVEREWLAEYVNAIRTYPAVGVFGGSITPEFEGTPPEWLVASLPVIGGVYGVSHDLQGEIKLDAPHLPLGGNMAFRAELLRRHRFDARYGRTAGNLLASEETAVLRTLLGSVATGRWVPTARAKHFIPKRMQTLDHVRRYFHDYGVSMMSTTSTDSGATVLGRPLWMCRQALWHEMRYRLGRFVARPDRWMIDLKWASLAWGGLRRSPARVPKS